MKHTPGPWKLRRQAVGGFGFYIETVDQSHDNTYIGDVGGGLQTQPEIEANAKIIAAAPDMLKALIEIEGEVFDDDANVKILFDIIDRIKKVAYETIKKATE